MKSKQRKRLVRSNCTKGYSSRAAGKPCMIMKTQRRCKTWKQLRGCVLCLSVFKDSFGQCFMFCGLICGLVRVTHVSFYSYFVLDMTPSEAPISVPLRRNDNAVWFVLMNSNIWVSGDRMARGYHIPSQLPAQSFQHVDPEHLISTQLDHSYS